MQPAPVHRSLPSSFACGKVDAGKGNICDNRMEDLTSAQTGDITVIGTIALLTVLSAATIVLLVGRKRNMA